MYSYIIVFFWIVNDQCITTSTPREGKDVTLLQIVVPEVKKVDDLQGANFVLAKSFNVSPRENAWRA